MRLFAAIKNHPFLPQRCKGAGGGRKGRRPENAETASRRVESKLQKTPPYGQRGFCSLPAQRTRRRPKRSGLRKLQPLLYHRIKRYVKTKRRFFNP
jgi:hypothetical protein